MIRGKTANTNLNVFGLTGLGFELTTFCTRGKHTLTIKPLRQSVVNWIKDQLYYSMNKWLNFFCDFRFLEDLEEGIYIQHSLESVLINEDGKQLLVSNLLEWIQWRTSVWPSFRMFAFNECYYYSYNWQARITDSLVLLDKSLEIWHEIFLIDKLCLSKAIRSCTSFCSFLLICIAFDVI